MDHTRSTQDPSRPLQDDLQTHIPTSTRPSRPRPRTYTRSCTIWHESRRIGINCSILFGIHLTKDYQRSNIIEVEQQALYRRWLEVAIQLVTILAEEEEQEEAQSELQRKAIRRGRTQRRKAIWCRQLLPRSPLYGQYEPLLPEQSPWDYTDR